MSWLCAVGVNSYLKFQSHEIHLSWLKYIWIHLYRIFYITMLQCGGEVVYQLIEQIRFTHGKKRTRINPASFIGIGLDRSKIHWHLNFVLFAVGAHFHAFNLMVIVAWPRSILINVIVYQVNRKFRIIAYGLDWIELNWIKRGICVGIHFVCV